MKAWIVENTSSDYSGDDWNEIVFADTYREAKKKATYTSLCENSNDFLNLRVKRYPDMDDTENLNHKDYTYKLWLSGWMWYSKYYKESESNEID